MWSIKIDLKLTSHACVHAKARQSCVIFCDPWIAAPAGSSVHGILQARILERVAMPSFTTNTTWEAPNFTYFF